MNVFGLDRPAFRTGLSGLAAWIYIEVWLFSAPDRVLMGVIRLTSCCADYV